MHPTLAPPRAGVLCGTLGASESDESLRACACVCRARMTPFHRVSRPGLAIVDLRSSPDHPLGDAVDVFVQSEEAERFVD